MKSFLFITISCVDLRIPTFFLIKIQQKLGAISVRVSFIHSFLYGTKSKKTSTTSKNLKKQKGH